MIGNWMDFFGEQQPPFCSWKSQTGCNGDYFGAARNVSEFQKLCAICITELQFLQPI